MIDLEFTHLVPSGWSFMTHLGFINLISSFQSFMIHLGFYPVNYFIIASKPTAIANIYQINSLLLAFLLCHQLVSTIDQSANLVLIDFLVD